MSGPELPKFLRWRARGDDLRKVSQLLAMAADAADRDDGERAKELLAVARVYLGVAARRLGFVAAPPGESCR